MLLPYDGLVWNLTVAGSPTFQTQAGMSHNTQKPVVLFETPILNHIALGEACYDPFIGSGTTLIAAARSGRRCYAVEINPKYADVVRKRWTRYAVKHGIDPGPGALS